MTLIDDAKTVALKAWSMRLIYAAALFDTAQVVLQLTTPEKPPTWFVALSAVVTMGAGVARLWPQPNMRAEIANADPTAR